MTYQKYFSLLVISLFFSFNAYSQDKKLDYKKTIEDAEYNQCTFEKKLNSTFIIFSYVGNVQLSTSKGKPLAPLNEIDFDKSVSDKIMGLYYCTSNKKYQEIKVSAKGFPEMVIALTPSDFKNGVPKITIFEEGKESLTINKPKTVFEKMVELKENEFANDITETPSINKYGKLTKKTYVQKVYDKSECNYCVATGKKYKCFVVISGLKGGKVMDGKERLPHTKMIKLKDTIRKYVFCVKADKYKEYVFKAKGYNDVPVEIIPNDFSNNRTPVITFYDENQKALFEEKQTESVDFLYSKKSSKRWDCESCEKETANSACILICSHLPDLVLNDEHNIISPKEVKVLAGSLKQYTFCVNLNTKVFMVSQKGYEPSLLKVTFEDLETVGATVFTVSNRTNNLDNILLEAETERVKQLITTLTTPAQEQKEIEVKAKEFRVQLIAKILDNYNEKKMQAYYNLPVEVKEDYDGTWRRFTVGSYAKYEDAVKAMNDFKTKNKKATDAFIVLYENGKRIGIYNPSHVKK